MADKLSQGQILRNTVEALSAESSLKHVCQRGCGSGPLPSQSAVEQIIELSRAIIFPGFFGDGEYSCGDIVYSIGVNAGRLQRILTDQIMAGFSLAGGGVDREPLREKSSECAISFIASLPSLRLFLAEDVEAIFRGDPAAVSQAEVIYSYPAVRAIANYRVAHRLYELGVPVLPRMICERAHRETGIDIHPGASIGRAFMIDHGTGVVIGETAVIGDNVRIYQGVTLGARSFPTDEHDNPVKGLPRHPIIGDNVVIYANSTILGRITVGSGSVIGGNIWITEDVAPGSVIVQARADNTIRQKRNNIKDERTI